MYGVIIFIFILLFNICSIIGLFRYWGGFRYSSETEQEYHEFLNESKSRKIRVRLIFVLIFGIYFLFKASEISFFN
ncbi:hypothetical protein GCM10027429_18330 [Marivirga atlantica]|jgi:hypothetical protein